MKRKNVTDWLALRGKEHKEYLEQVNRYLASINVAEVDLLQQYNKAYADLKNDLNTARGMLYENYYDTKCKHS